MRGNVVYAAAIFGAAVLLASGLLVWGVRAATDRAAARFENAVRDHAQAVERGGAQAGTPIRDAMLDVAAAMDKHSVSVERAGVTISKPAVTMTSPLAVQQPLRIAGPERDGSLPVDAKLSK